MCGANVSNKINLFVDKYQELRLAIDFIEGKIKEEKYIIFLAGDEADAIISLIGSACK